MDETNARHTWENIIYVQNFLLFVHPQKEEFASCAYSSPFYRSLTWWTGRSLDLYFGVGGGTRVRAAAVVVACVCYHS